MTDIGQRGAEEGTKHGQVNEEMRGTKRKEMEVKVKQKSRQQPNSGNAKAKGKARDTCSSPDCKQINQLVPLKDFSDWSLVASMMPTSPPVRTHYTPSGGQSHNRYTQNSRTSEDKQYGLWFHTDNRPFSYALSCKTLRGYI